MRKATLIFFASFASLFLLSAVTQAELVPCGQTVANPCQLGHLFTLILNIYNFLVLWIATPLAGLLIVIGGIILLVSAGNPGWTILAKRMLWWAVIAWLLVFGSWLIIDFVLKAIGYTGSGSWSSF